MAVALLRKLYLILRIVHPVVTLCAAQDLKRFPARILALEMALLAIKDDLIAHLAIHDPNPMCCSASTL